MVKKEEKNVAVFDKVSGQTIILKDSDAKKLAFFNYRLFFILALAIVTLALFDINKYYVVGFYIILMIVLEIVYRKFYKSLVILDKKLQREDRPTSKTQNHMLVRALVYSVLGVGIIITTFLQYKDNIGVNESVLIIIGAIAVYTGFVSLRKYLS